MEPKRPTGLRQQLAPIHTWTGLIVGWLLFIIFFAGTLSVFRPELDLWFRPEVPPQSAISKAQATQTAVDYLQKNQPNALRWLIFLPEERKPLLKLYWVNPPREMGSIELAPINPDLPIRATEGGNFFTEFHHELHYVSAKVGYTLISLVSVVALVAIIAGVIIHRRIFIDFFTFHKGKKLKSWLDAHNLLSVMPLPFHLMIIYTGVIILGLHGVMTFNIEKTLPQFEHFFSEIKPFQLPEREGGAPMAMPDIQPYLHKLEQEWGKDGVRLISINNPNREKAALLLAKNNPTQVSSIDEYRVYRLADGQLQLNKNQFSHWIYALGGVFNLHLASFANYPLLWLYFVFGLAGCAMIASGSIMWIIKRRDRKNPPTRGIWWVARLNLAVYAGFPLACVSYFYANRLLPVQLDEREAWEIHCLFLVWLAVALFAFCKRSLLGKKVQMLMKLAGYALLALPALDIWAGRAPWLNLWHWNTLYLSIELCAVCLGISCLWIEKRIRFPSQ